MISIRKPKDLLLIGLLLIGALLVADLARMNARLKALDRQLDAIMERMRPTSFGKKNYLAAYELARQLCPRSCGR